MTYNICCREIFDLGIKSVLKYMDLFLDGAQHLLLGNIRPWEDIMGTFFEFVLFNKVQYFFVGKRYDLAKIYGNILLEF